MSQSDGIDDALVGVMRVAVMAAGRVGAELVRARQEQLRLQQMQSEQQARQMAGRYEAEMRLAIAQLEPVHRPQWWDQATPDTVGQAYVLATARATDSAEASRAHQRIREELTRRYGIDVDRTPEAEITSEIRRWEERLHNQRQATAQRQQADSERAEATALLGVAQSEQAVADNAQGSVSAETGGGRSGDSASNSGPDSGQQVDPANPWMTNWAAREASAEEAAPSGEHEAHRLWDSADRRSDDALKLEEGGIASDVVASRMRADAGAAEPATKATRSTTRGPSAAALARKSTGRQTSRPDRTLGR